MRITNKTVIATSVLAIIAEQRKRYHPVAEMALEIGVSVSYLEHLIKELRNAGVVAGRRGPGGGYRLCLPADQLTIARIAEIVDPADARGHGNDFWQEAARLLAREATSVTIADVINAPQHDQAAA